MMSVVLSKSFKMFLSGLGISMSKAVLVFVIGYIAIKIILKIVARAMGRAKLEKVARKFIYNFIKYGLYLVLSVIIATTMGVPTTAFIAILSALGLALSLAMQGSLSNLANGIVIIISKPFKDGDVVTVNEHVGFVKEIKLTHTILTGLDNNEISIPNKIIVENVVLNSTVIDPKKISYNFVVAYKSDVEKVKNIILRTFNATNYILKTPAPFVGIEKLETNGIKFLAYGYVESKHYWELYYNLQEEIFNELKKEKVVFPFAQMDVMLKQEKETLPFYMQSKLKQKAEKQDVEKDEKEDKNFFEKILSKFEKEEETKSTPKKKQKHNMQKVNEIEIKKPKEFETNDNMGLNANEVVEVQESDDDDDIGLSKDYLNYVNEIEIIEEDEQNNLENFESLSNDRENQETSNEEESDEEDENTKNKFKKNKFFKKFDNSNKKKTTIIKKK